jgi:hypothetical protein
LIILAKDGHLIKNWFSTQMDALFARPRLRRQLGECRPLRALPARGEIGIGIGAGIHELIRNAHPPCRFPDVGIRIPDDIPATRDLSVVHTGRRSPVVDVARKPGIRADMVSELYL